MSPSPDQKDNNDDDKQEGKHHTEGNSRSANSRSHKEVLWNIKRRTFTQHERFISRNLTVVLLESLLPGTVMRVSLVWLMFLCWTLQVKLFLCLFSTVTLLLTL